ncbi:tetratricopeptide repeat protein [Priestia flexa]|uniref:tetratricopeptide repeat protein n=1 Tax=Priestia flexa TaxID=86664 RepID=UPI0015865ADF|nr:tetratricopeptide repeat protein [Priestia flexa]MCA1204088.1 tetratricopeptide repeat protein [Priestia flexa]MCG7314833.1 tetratricopeptide repeat protein [Priestia flexa]WHX79793.1 tetratricopeptide repeat protein [Priestia flexa]
MFNTLNIDQFPRKRENYVEDIRKAWVNTESAPEEFFLTLVGESGSGKLDTLKYFLSKDKEGRTTLFTDGNKVSNGYFAGFYELFIHMFSTCEKKYPKIIEKYEQSIKRLFPFLNSNSYKVPKDLTNTAPQDERTRFYHHEFQDKLLHGIYEFSLDYCLSTGEMFTLVIDEANHLSPTIQSLIKIMASRKKLNKYIRVVLLFDDKINLSHELKRHCYEVEFNPLQREELVVLLNENKREDLSEKAIDDILHLSQGNISKCLVLIKCMNESLPVFDYLSFDTYVDFYLSRKGEAYKYSLLKKYINEHCTNDNPVYLRNYQTASKKVVDHLHREKIKELKNEEKIMHLVHYTSLSCEVEQLTSLSPIAIKLQEIGVYNTWFDLFSKYFTNHDLRNLPNGDELHNAVFVRMSFILYSLGVSKMSIPYLDFFYNNFPESKLIPMILYSQSMTYGRYQVPVDLEKAEKYALMNLEKIDSIFKDHPKYVYIKVFAENALAYIRARQGRLQEAIELCTVGLDKMKDIYGETKYALHQSILIYNTGQVYEILGDFEKAREMYEHAIRLDPYYGEYYNDLANLLQKHGYVEESLSYYQKAIDLCPPYYEAHINRAGAYEKLSNLEEAISDYERALELKPDASYVYSNLSTIFYQKEEYSKALNLIDKAIYYNNKEADFYNNKGLILQEINQLESAASCYQKAIELNPKSSEAYSNAAILAYSEKRLDESLNLINKAVELSNDPDYKINRGIVYKELNEYKKAIDDFNFAKEIKKEDSFLDSLIQEVSTSLKV